MSNLNQAQLSALMKKKEPVLGVLLVFILGPLGYFYVSIMGGVFALIVEVILIVISALTAGLAGFMIPVFHVFLAVLAFFSIRGHNSRLINNL